MFKLVTFAAALAAGVSAHGDHSQEAFKEGPHKSLWYNTLPGDGGTQADSVFSGTSTLALRTVLVPDSVLAVFVRVRDV